jgi:hypothetical protein
MKKVGLDCYSREWKENGGAQSVLWIDESIRDVATTLVDKYGGSGMWWLRWKCGGSVEYVSTHLENVAAQ